MFEGWKVWKLARLKKNIGQLLPQSLYGDILRDESSCSLARSCQPPSFEEVFDAAIVLLNLHHSFQLGYRD